MRFILIFILLFSGAASIQAQALNDPLKKPDIWEELKLNPADEGLWYKYMGKELQYMTAREEDQMNAWRSELLLLYAQRRREKEQREEQAAEKKRKAAEAEILRDPYKGKTPKEIRAIKTQEALILEEPDDLAELKDNLYVNFEILEERYATEFERLGGTYKTYSSAHPNSDYPPAKWCEEQEKKIQQLKEARIRALHLGQ